jgi:carboxyl-terminal processing protease
MPSIDFGGRARGVALFAFLGLAIAGCAGSGSGTDPSALSRQMFEAGFEDIDQVYIDKPDIGGLALAGMQQLSTIDSDLTARRTGDKVELLLKNQIAYSRTVDADYDAEDWGDLTADVLTEATADSEKIKSAPTEKVYEAMFSGVVGKLDQF